MIFFDKFEKLLVVVIILICICGLGASGFFNELLADSQNPAEYHVSNSTFKIYNWWTFVNNSSTNNSVKFTNYYSAYLGEPLYEVSLILTQYNNTHEFELKSYNSSNLSNNYSVKTENRNIQGIEVKFVNSTNINTNHTYLYYYFQKNGKYYCIYVTGENYSVNVIHNNRIETTVELIISTIN